ncbi:MAG: phosphoribosylamine--glycine ligase, partial [Chitinophagaceae bacterium]|nr:phosphoribosylamine--glycine ligase [Chitinophagaceae bacterium]
ISPVPFISKAFMQKIKTKIIEPTINALQKENLDYRGFIFFGLMKVDDEPYVIEYNCRMGDPETEVVFPRIKNDLVELLQATAEQQLYKYQIEVDERYACTIVAVSKGYPSEYEKGFEINFPSLADEETIFHMGTKAINNKIITNGGRVVCATALANTLQEAVRKSKEMIEKIKFENKYYRGDIGYEFIPPAPKGEFL